MKTFEEIYESYINGQFKQMVKQVGELGVYNFADCLEWVKETSSDDALKMAIIYLRISNS